MLTFLHTHLFTAVVTAIIINNLLCTILLHRLGELRDILHIDTDVGERLFGVTDFSAGRANQSVDECTPHERFDKFRLIGVLQGLVNSIQESREIFVCILWMRKAYG